MAPALLALHVAMWVRGRTTRTYVVFLISARSPFSPGEKRSLGFQEICTLPASRGHCVPGRFLCSSSSRQENRATPSTLGLSPSSCCSRKALVVNLPPGTLSTCSLSRATTCVHYIAISTS